MRPKLLIAKHNDVLEKLGLLSIEQVKQFRGELVKDHNGERDVLRIVTETSGGEELILFLKRTWNPRKKDGLASFARRGTVWSIARQEWENAKALESAGLKTAGLVAYGEECGALWEKFSFILTEAARGRTTVEQFLRECLDPALRRSVFDALAREIKRMHEAGLATPDLFTRHIFVETAGAQPEFYFIDMARMNRARKLSERLRVRDLSALNATAPLRFVTARERIRFLKTYAGKVEKLRVKSIELRTAHLLKREKFQDFLKNGEAQVH